MLIALNLLFSLLVAQGELQSKFSVEVELVKATSREEVSIKATVKNISGDTIKVLKYRRQDYRFEKIKSFGNYIIELERWENNQYVLFPPSADIDPTFENQEYISLPPGDTLSDKLFINGYSFSIAGSNKRGFSPGKYRLRVFFNEKLSQYSNQDHSAWIEFKID